MTLRIIPRPASYEVTGDPFVINADTTVHGSPAFIRHVRNYLGPATGYAFADVDASATNVIRATLDAHHNGPGGAYALEVTPTAIQMTAGDEAGLFYALQTLRQMMPPDIYCDSTVYGVPWVVPGVRIEDAPRFAWRGVMLDCARYFFDVDYVKRFIDLIVLHKFNVFHWHLTDDQGWRVEIRKYPKLTEVGAWRDETLLGHSKDQPRKFDGRRYGGFYTQQQMREVVAYAAQRHVMVIPEIEMPGHSRAAIAAYPELGNTPEPWPVGTAWGIEKHILNAEESTIRFYQDVLDEVLEIFPSPFIHIGGDEAVKDEWKASPRIQERIRELGLRNEEELQAYIIKRMDHYLTQKGRRLVGWDEILQGELAPGATVMSWRGPEGGVKAAQMGHDVVMCRQDLTYMDFYQAEDQTMSEPLAIHRFLSLEKAYTYDPTPDELTPEQARHVLGGQAQVWTEYLPDPERIHYMMYPRAMAIAEALWTVADQREYADFRRRVPHHMRVLQRLGVHGRPLD